MIKLFAPDHSGQCLSLDVAAIVIRNIGLQFVVKGIGFLLSLSQLFVEAVKRRR